MRLNHVPSEFGKIILGKDFRNFPLITVTGTNCFMVTEKDVTLVKVYQFGHRR